MPIDVQKLKAWPFEPITHRYTERDTMLYALGVGLGHDPLDIDALRYVYEPQLQALPTMGVVLGYPGFWAKDPATGIDWVRVLHGEQSLELHAPLPAAGTVIGTSRVTALVDKGAAKGALMFSERDITDAASGSCWPPRAACPSCAATAASASAASPRTRRSRSAWPRRIHRPTRCAS